MAFESKRLRVQLPCSSAGSLVERPVPEPICPTFRSPGPDPFCRFPTKYCFRFTNPCGIVSPDPCRYFGSPDPCLNSPNPCWNNVTEIPCGFPSPDIGTCGQISPVCIASPDPTIFNITDRILPDPEEEGAVLIRPEDLPIVKQQLEVELSQIAALRERGEQLESQLEEIRSAEQELEGRKESS